MKISHEQATALEFVLRHAYNCGRYGVVGLANADFLENSPLSAAVAVLAPLSLRYSAEDLNDVSEFWDKYRFELSHDEFDDNLIDQCIEDLRKLVNKYY